MFLASVVVMVLPPSYADWREIDCPEQVIKSFELFKQIGVPVESVNPVMWIVESESVVNVTSLVELGVKVEELLAFNDPLATTPPVNVEVPLPRKEKDGFVVALPKEIFSVPLEVLMLM